MMKELTLTIRFDPAIIDDLAITDALNHWLHAMALTADWPSDEETGAYVGFDWEYDEATQKATES